MGETPPVRRPPYLVRLVRIRWRLATSILLAIVVTALLPSTWPISRRCLIGWDAGIVCYLVLVLILVATAQVEHIRGHAARDDEGRFAILVLTVLAAVASFGAIFAELSASPGAARTPMHLTLAAITIALSWFFTHTIFALNYAHDYYGEHGGKRSGLDFPGEGDPDYWDFVYFSFVVGTTCQVSDVEVTSRLMRRTVMAHGVLSFFFNTTLLALTVNIAASAI